jgi:hypothetical protein
MPRGILDRRFRGNSCGRGANLTLRGVTTNEEEEEVVVGRIDDNSKDEDLDEEICLLKGILRVKGHLVCGCGSRDSISRAMDSVDDNTPKMRVSLR